MRAGERFRDREDAGARLAALVAARVGDAPCVVLAIPRGGVAVAVPVARALGAPLDLVVPRKVGAPHNPELGIGAVAPGGVRVLDDDLIARLGLREAEIERAVAAAEDEVRRREQTYRAGRTPPDLRGRTAVLVDDGIATGGTALAAAAWARAAGAERVILAVPVAPGESLAALRRSFDDLIVVSAPLRFVAVGQWYERFDQVEDAEVRATLDAYA
jgi:predicted phosphoribosyltransferase